MKIKLNKRFKKQYSKSPPNVQKAFQDRFQIFIKSPYSSILRNHPLKHEWKGCRSIDVTGDWRAIYYESENKLITFRAIGTHSNLYKH